MKPCCKLCYFFIRRIWADYLDSQGIRYIFFSAVLAQEKLVKEQSEVIDADNVDNTLESQDDSNDGSKSTTKWPAEKVKRTFRNLTICYINNDLLIFLHVNRM